MWTAERAISDAAPDALPSAMSGTVTRTTALLIVAPLFFIQRRTGEVAEWSKALPC
jgi:hypothetical protein